MKITFLGTGAAEGVPAMFCSCEFCRNLRAEGKGYRTRSQVLVDGELSIDFPPEAYYHSLRFGVDLSALKYLLVTHSHMDHFYAHDFILRGYKYARLSEGVLNIYGNEEVGKVFSECTRREMKPEVSPNIKLHTVNAYAEFAVGEYRVLTLPAIHSATEEALLYFIERQGKGYLHLYDTGGFSDEAVEFLKSRGAFAHVVALDCTFLDAPARSGTRHMCLEDCALVISRLTAGGVTDKNTKFIITHFSHNANPTAERISKLSKEYGVIAAYDGFSVEI